MHLPHKQPATYGPNICEPATPSVIGPLCCASAPPLPLCVSACVCVCVCVCVVCPGLIDWCGGARLFYGCRARQRTARQLAGTFCAALSTAFAKRAAGLSDSLLVVCPEHFNTFRRDGWDKDTLRVRRLSLLYTHCPSFRDGKSTVCAVSRTVIVAECAGLYNGAYGCTNV